MDGVFVSLMQRLMAMGFNVFNQKRDLAGVSVRRRNQSHYRKMRLATYNTPHPAYHRSTSS